MSSSLGLLLLDRGGTIRAADEGASVLLQTKASSLVGTSFFSLAGGEGAREAYLRSAGTERIDLDCAVAGARVRIRSLEDGEELRVVALVFGPPTPEEAELAKAAELAGQVKHDINNLLMGLLGHVTLLRDRVELPEAARKRIEVIQEQGRKIRDRVSDLDLIRKRKGAIQ